MCQIISKHDVALSLSRLTGCSHEQSLMTLNGFNKPKAFSSCGNFDARGFKGLAQSEGVSDGDITREVCRLTGKSFETIFTELNIIPVTPLEKTRINLNKTDSLRVNSPKPASFRDISNTSELAVETFIRPMSFFDSKTDRNKLKSSEEEEPISKAEVPAEKVASQGGFGLRDFNPNLVKGTWMARMWGIE